MFGFVFLRIVLGCHSAEDAMHSTLLVNTNLRCCEKLCISSVNGTGAIVKGFRNQDFFTARELLSTRSSIIDWVFFCIPCISCFEVRLRYCLRGDVASISSRLSTQDIRDTCLTLSSS